MCLHPLSELRTAWRIRGARFHRGLGDRSGARVRAAKYVGSSRQRELLRCAGHPRSTGDSTRKPMRVANSGGELRFLAQTPACRAERTRSSDPGERKLIHNDGVLLPIIAAFTAMEYLRKYYCQIRQRHPRTSVRTFGRMHDGFSRQQTRQAFAAVVEGSEGETQRGGQLNCGR